jgi:hypothetical protein
MAISSRRLRAWHALALLALAAAPARALFEDQAGKHEWLRQHVGEVRLAQPSPAPDGPLFVAAAGGVVAALARADGALLWRALLDESESVDRLEVGAEAVVAVTGGARLRAFAPASGALLWEALLEAAPVGAPPAALALARGALGAEVVVVAHRGGARGYAARSGAKLWTAPGLAAPGAAPAAGAGAAPGEVVVAFLSPAGDEVASVRLRAATGDVVEQGTAAVPAALAPESLSVLGAGVAALTADGRRACAGAPGAAASLACAPVEPGSRVVPGGGCADALALQSPAGAALLRLPGGGAAPEVAAAFPAAVASACRPDAAGAGASAAALASLAPGAGVAVQLAAAAGRPGVRATAPALHRADAAGVRLGPAAAFAAGGGAALVRLAEGSLALVGADGAVAWTRLEALAAVEDILFADLPPPTAESEAAWAARRRAAAAAAGGALAGHALALKAQLGLASAPERAELARRAAAASERLRPTRDADGLRRQLVVASKSGKVAALHTGDGAPLWAIDLGAPPAGAALRLARWRAPHAAGGPELLAAFVAAGPWVNVTVFDAATGAVAATDAVPVGASGAELLELPAAAAAPPGGAEQRVFVVVPLPGPGAGAATALPRSSAAAAAALAAQAPTLTFWRADAATGYVRGYALDSDLHVREAWALAAAPPGSGLALLDAAQRDPDEPLYSAARPLAGGGVLLKHASPNALLVLAGTAAGAAAPRIEATLLDAASGRVLASQAHAGASGPARAALAEHSAYYHYWSVNASRWEVSTLELYRAAPAGLSVVSLALGGGAAAAAAGGASAWAAPPALRVDRAAFALRLPAAALAVTRTARGVAARMLLVGAPGGQVLQVDRRFLDARRPVLAPGAKPTAESQAEGVPAYSPELPVAGPAFATHGRRVARLRLLRTAPAVLESAAPLAAAGLDLFYARLQPSRGFDEVPEDFPAALLLAVMAAMAAGAAAMRSLLQRRALMLKWA